ncbi:MAG TPA: NAD(P)H-hydrate dehydratase, partial [Bacteroidales bacterium]
IESEPIKSADLMERAAWQCTHWLMARFGKHQHFHIFCGSGNNGGDGLAIARQLDNQDYLATVYLVAGKDKLSPDAALNLGRLKNTRVHVRFENIEEHLPAIKEEDVIVDAVLGSGLNKPLDGRLAELIGKLNKIKANKIAIDIPTGLMDVKANTGQTVFNAQHTLTFQFPFLSFFFAENAQFVGDWTVLDIGLDKNAVAQTQVQYVLTETSDIHIKKRLKFGHKGTFGHALIIAGSRSMPGAAILSAKAALRSGCGLLTSHVPSALAGILPVAINEAILSLDKGDNYTSNIPEIIHYSAVAVGPGLGITNSTKTAFSRLIKSRPKNLVIDADALNILASKPQLKNELPANTILTPHHKEFDRLFGLSANSEERLARLIENAISLDIIIVLKGHYSIVALPSGHCYFNPTGNNGMATAGSGDVLTGVIVSLLAQGYDAAHAAITAVFLHGLAGDIAAKELCQESLMANDIINALPKAFKQIETAKH